MHNFSFHLRPNSIDSVELDFSWLFQFHFSGKNDFWKIQGNAWCFRLKKEELFVVEEEVDDN